MKEPNEVPTEKISSLEARIQQKNKERMENRQKLAQNQEKMTQLQTQKRKLEAVQNELESETAKLLAELKAIKMQSRADHCDRHPRMLAGLRVDCGGERGHLLCVSCIRSWSSNLLGQCPLCGKPVKNCGIDIKEKDEIVDRLVADEKMLRSDSFLPLPFELGAEIWKFAKKHSFIFYGKNRWQTEAGSFTSNLKFDGLSVNKDDGSQTWSTVRAVKPFCVMKSALIDYCVPNVFYFEVLVKTGYIYIGLSGADFPLSKDTYVGKVRGSYSLDSWANYYAAQNWFHSSQLGEKGWFAMEGDVAGCGLLLSPNNNRHRLFFTKNGQLFCKPILLPAMEANNQLLFPTVTLIHDTSIEANFGDDPERQFRYKFKRGASCNNNDDD